VYTVASEKQRVDTGRTLKEFKAENKKRRSGESEKVSSLP
jgi:hypothetical protein